MANLVELFDNIVQMQNLNGVPLANGKMYVYALGRTRLMDTWSDVDGESLNSNPIILDAAGQCHCYVSDDFDYTLVVTDAYDNEIFSIDKYLYSQGSHSHADVAVAPSETIAVSSYHVGETTVYVPYLTGQLGKVYEGIDPIVVNNVEDKISANHVPLGVQDPLYFVQDDEEACIIGFSGQTIPEGVMTESALGFENDKITGYNGSAFSAGNEYEAGSYVDITDNTISVTGLPTSADVQNIVDVATSGLMPSGDYLTKESADTLYAPTGNYLTGLPDDLVYSADITGFATTAELDNKLDKADSANFLLTSDSAKFYPMDSNPSGYITAHQSLAGYATEQWVEDKGYITGIDIAESAGWNEATTVVNNNSAIWNNTTNVVSSNSAQWGASNPQIPVTGINGIKISESGDQVVFEVSGDYATTAQLADKQDSLSYGYHDNAISSIDESALYDTSAQARINTLAGRISDLSSNKLDTSAFSDVSGTFLTAVPDTYLQNTDLTIVDNKITEISGVPLSAGDEFPQSATDAIGYVTATSANIDSTINNVATNSGVWGGSALPISAGPGIKFEMVNDTLVASTDETMLFSGSDAWGYGTITLSESLKNFERIKVLATRAYSADGNTDKYSGPWCEFDCAGIASTTASWGAVTPAIYEGPYWKYSTYTANATFTQLNWSQGGYIKVTNPSDYAEATSWIDGKAVGIKAVVGINRK